MGKEMKKNKKAGIDLSFNVIFSLILIIVFIAVAIYGIIFFLNMQKCSDIGMFKQDLQNEVEGYWRRTGVEINQSLEISLTNEIEYVCFVDFTEEKKGEWSEFYEDLEWFSYEEENMFFYPPGNACQGMEGFKIERINIQRITQENNPYCIPNIDGVVTTRIIKHARGDVLVCIGSDC
jgi:hypothetical protein